MLKKEERQNMSINVCIDNVQTRIEHFEGRAHLVAPVILLVEGVHDGSGGKVYYPPEELASFVPTWNGIPLPVYHPLDDAGFPISANDPKLVEEKSVGRLWHVEWNDEKLKGEIWIDVEKTKAVAPEVLAKIQNDRQLEVSTGLWFDADLTPGEWNGEKYDMIARSLRPDHLALLPDGKGACSWADGCGVRANADDRTYASWRNMLQRCYNKKAPNYKMYGAKGITVVKKWADSYDAFLKDMGKRPKGKNLNRINPKKGYSPGNCNWKAKLGRDLKKNKEKGGDGVDVDKYLSPFFNEISHGEIRSQLRGLLPAGNEGTWYFIRDVFDGFFVYAKEVNEKASLFKQAYAKDASDVVSLSGDAVEVVEKVEYVQTNLKKEVTQMAEKKVCCPKQVAALIANDLSTFVDDDKDWLEVLTEEQLAKLEPVAPEKVVHFDEVEWDKLTDEQKAKVKTNLSLTEVKAEGDDDTPATVDEYVANAPEAMQDVLKDGLRMYNDKKTKMVNEILANKRNKFSKDVLEKKDAEELEALVELGKSAPADYSANEPSKESGKDDEPLDMPVLNFDKK